MIRMLRSVFTFELICEDQPRALARARMWQSGLATWYAPKSMTDARVGPRATPPLPSEVMSNQQQFGIAKDIERVHQ